jgi:hypothetical protein
MSLRSSLLSAGLMPVLAEACTACTAALQAAIATPEAEAAADLLRMSQRMLSLWAECTAQFLARKQLSCPAVAVTYLPAAKLAVAVLDQAQARLIGSQLSSSSSSRGGVPALFPWLAPCWYAVHRAVNCLLCVLLSLREQPAVLLAARGVAEQRQGASALLASNEAKVLLAMLMGACARQLHNMRHGRSPAASFHPAAAAAGVSRQRQERRLQQQQQQQQQEPQPLVPALHTQLLDQFGMQEDLLAGTRADDAIGMVGNSTEETVLAVMFALQLCLNYSDGNPLPVRGMQQGAVTGAAAVNSSDSGSSSSSSSGALCAELRSALLQTVVEAQLRPARPQFCCYCDLQTLLILCQLGFLVSCCCCAAADLWVSDLVDSWGCLLKDQQISHGCVAGNSDVHIYVVSAAVTALFAPTNFCRH